MGVHREPYGYVLDFAGADAFAGNDTQVGVIDIDRETDFALFRLSALATSFNMRATLRDQNDRIFGQNSIPLVNLFGTGQWPMRLLAPRMLRRTNQLRVQLTDASGAANTVRLLFSGAQVYPSAPFAIPKFRAAEPYWLALNFGGEATDDLPQVPANGTAQGAIRTPGDSWFEVHRIVIARTGVATIQFATDGYQEWFRRAVHVDLLGASNMTGAFDGVASRFPSAWGYELNPGKLLAPNRAVNVTVTDLSGAGNPTRVTLHGIRRYE